MNISVTDGGPGIRSGEEIVDETDATFAEDFRKMVDYWLDEKFCDLKLKVTFDTTFLFSIYHSARCTYVHYLDDISVYLKFFLFIRRSVLKSFLSIETYW